MEKASIRNTYQSILIGLVAFSIYTLLSLKASIKEGECCIIGGGQNQRERQPWRSLICWQKMFLQLVLSFILRCGARLCSRLTWGKWGDGWGTEGLPLTNTNIATNITINVSRNTTKNNWQTQMRSVSTLILCVPCIINRIKTATDWTEKDYDAFVQTMIMCALIQNTNATGECRWSRSRNVP